MIFFLFEKRPYHCTSLKDSFSQNHKTVAAKTKILSFNYAILERNNNLPLTIMYRVKNTCILNTKKYKCNKLKNIFLLLSFPMSLTHEELEWQSCFMQVSL